MRASFFCQFLHISFALVICTSQQRQSLAPLRCTSHFHISLAPLLCTSPLHLSFAALSRLSHLQLSFAPLNCTYCLHLSFAHLIQLPTAFPPPCIALTQKSVQKSSENHAKSVRIEARGTSRGRCGALLGLPLTQRDKNIQNVSSWTTLWGPS